MKMDQRQNKKRSAAAASDDVKSAGKELKDLNGLGFELKNLRFDLNPGLGQPQPRRSSRLQVDDPDAKKQQKKRPRGKEDWDNKGTDTDTSADNHSSNDIKSISSHGNRHGRKKHDDGSTGAVTGGHKDTFKSAEKSSIHTIFFDEDDEEKEEDDFLDAFDSNSSNSSSSSSSNSSSINSNNNGAIFLEALSTFQEKLTLQQRLEVMTKLEIDPLNPPYSIDFTIKHVCNKACKYTSNRKDVKNTNYNSKTKQCHRSGKLEENCFPRLIDCNPYDKNIWTVFIDADEVVIEDTDIDIEFYYPFSGSFKFPFHSEEGFTRKGIVNLIRETYCKIYISERATAIVEDDSSEREYMNRTYTDGLFGIHSHEFEDLFLELIRYNPFTRVVSMIVGSWNQNEDNE